jgi:2-oxoglutarate ferredoxin oxidoreductase subunit alpha
MQVSIGFSWPAGSWVNTSWLLLAELLSNKGYTVYWDKEYASVIKGENNCFFLYISDGNEIFISKEIDYFLAYDQYAIEKNEKIYNLKNTFMFKDEKCTYKNTFAFWAAIRLFWIPLEEWKQVLEKQFNEKKLKKEVIDNNFKDLENGYEYIMHCWWEACIIINFDKVIGEKKHFMYWNELIAKWWIASWLDFYAAYPMTPASTIIDEIIKDDKVTFYQWEDEIAVSMAMLWAKFAWKRSMCWTSWGWFALMTESIWFSNQAEIWWVYILSQRDWPSTWTPTYTGQADLNYALNASFWDTKPIVFAPSTFEETYNFTWKALNWSDQYQHPVIMIVDKQLSESYLSINEKTLKAEKINRWEKIKKPEEDTYIRYKITESWISPYAIPWDDNTTFIASSYEHDEYWFTNEEPNTKKAMMDKRAKKLETFTKEEFNKNFYWYEIINPNAKTFYITMWINRYPIENHIKNKDELWLIIIKSFQPFDKRLKSFLDENEKNIKWITFVEMNQSWILEDLVRKECELYNNWNNKITHQRKYNLYPIFDEDII